MKRRVKLPDRNDDWWIEPLIKYTFLFIAIGVIIVWFYILVHFIRKFW